MVQFAAYVGWDWGSREHAIDVRGADGSSWRQVIPHQPGAMRELFDALHQRYGGQPVAVAIEQSRGPVIYALLECEFIHPVPVNPRALARYRESQRLSGACDDASDAALIRELVQKHPEQYSAWVPDDDRTRALRTLVEWRRKTVENRTALTQQLRDRLREYFPLALELVGDLDSRMAAAFLRRWPTLQALLRSRPDTIRDFFLGHRCRSRSKIDQRLEAIRTASPLTTNRAIIDSCSFAALQLVAQIETAQKSIAAYDREIATLWQEHPDGALFKSLPGAGPALAPRIAVAFGLDRDRWRSARAMQDYSGASPVKQQSGKYMTVRARWARPTFLYQTFHEFAAQSISKSDWAREYYREKQALGKQRHTILRGLAYRWIRVIFACWRDHVPYDEATYQESLRRTGSPLAHRLAA